VLPRTVQFPRPVAARFLLTGARPGAVQLALPQVGDDPGHALGQVPAAGAEGQPEQLSGVLLGGGRAQVGAVHRAQQLVVARVGGQERGGLADQGGQGAGGWGSLGVGPLAHHPRAQQRVGGQHVGSVQVVQGAPYSLVELGLGERERLRLAAGYGRRLELVVQRTPAHQGQPLLGRHPPPVAAEDAVAASADLEVGLGHPVVVQVGEHRAEGGFVRDALEVPGQVGRREPAAAGQDRDEVEGGRGALADVAIDHDAQVGDLLARPGRPVPQRVGPRGPGRGVGLDVLGRRPVQGQVHDEAEQHAVAAPEGDKGIRLPPEPMSGQRGRLLALAPGGHRHDRLVVVGGERVGVGLTEARPLPVLPGERVAPEREDQVQQRPLLLLAGAPTDAVQDVGLDAVLVDAVPLAVAPAQVRVEQVPGQVVRGQAVRPLLDERQRAQPLEDVVDLAGVERRPQQRLGGQPRERTHLQRTPVQLARDADDEARQQLAHDVGGVLGREVRQPRRVLLGQHIDHQRQGERVAAGEGQHPLVQRLGHAGRTQIRAAGVGPQVAQGDHPQQLAPGGLRAPGQPGRLPAGQHHDRVGRQLGQEALTQPVVQRCRPLVGVQQHDGAAAPGGERHPGVLVVL
jgi:hypothetical protein